MDRPEQGHTDDLDKRRRVTGLPLPDSALGSLRELEALFDQSPVAMVFNDRELRARRTNAAFRRLVGLPGEVIIGRRPSEFDHGVDAAMIEHALPDQGI